jgi:PleD family two-component response regulator
MPKAQPIAIVADADRHSIARVKECLGALKYYVLPVFSAQALLAAVVERPRSLLIARSSLPGLDAQRLCQQARVSTRNTHVILLLDDRSPAAIAAAFVAGADDVISEPIVDAELRARLQLAVRISALEEYRTRMSGEGTLLAEIASRASVHSRRYLEVQLGHELDRARRFSHPLALILAHVRTTSLDERLVRLYAEIFCQQLRTSVDWVARFAERTYAIVLPETGLSGALKVANRLQKAVSEYDFGAARSIRFRPWTCRARRS